MEAKIYLAKMRASIEKEYGARWGEIYTHFPEHTYIDPDNVEAVRELLNGKNFTPIHIQMTLILKDGNETVLGFNVPSALDLWNDYLHAIDAIIHDGCVQRMYGIDPVIMEMELLSEGLVQFKVGNEYPDHVFVNAKLPAVPFFLAILNAVRIFWRKLKCLLVNEKNLPPNNVIDFDRLMEWIDSLISKVRALSQDKDK
ncbi:hypothetical protein [Bacillus sp. FJAT-28004]|uniref:hypothetical protein n=1 Tax=Bacillus sp. FJAT-28004 TaxID=1679165 RepID=UPI0006B61D8A|nr:hypothetical protein [Bacillus sp. FJAT-28004]